MEAISYEDSVYTTTVNIYNFIENGNKYEMKEVINYDENTNIFDCNYTLRDMSVTQPEDIDWDNVSFTENDILILFNK